MIDLKELQRQYLIVEQSSHMSEDEQVRRKMNFVKKLMSDNSPAVVDYHYSLLKRREFRYLYYSIRAAMEERPNIAGFLLAKLDSEEDPVTQGDILHLLGEIKSNQAAPLAREFINHEDEYHRKVASYVIGWSGTRDDIALLQDHMLNEQDPQLRITAASAHRQMAWRHPELKYPILKSLQKGFETEKDDEVLSWIIVMIGTIALKPLGIREDNQEPRILHGNLEKAKKRTRAYLETLD